MLPHSRTFRKTLPAEKPFKVTPQIGAVLQDWCCEGKTIVSKELQQRIDSCTILSELYTLMFSEEFSDIEMVGAFTKRRLELEDARQRELEHDDYPF